MKTGYLVSVLLLIWLATPYLLLCRYFPAWQWPETSELIWALKNSCIQAFGSALLALISGGVLLTGLLRISPRLRPLGSWFLLSPSFFPPLFLILSFMSWVSPFPIGWVGIVAIQGFMNAGLIAVLLLQAIEAKLAGLSEAAQVMGASRRLFWRRSFALIRADLVSLGVFVFAVSFASFSIPLVVGGGKSTTLEILIFEKVRLSDEIGQTLSLSLVQLLVMFGFAFLPRSDLRLERGRSQDLSVWGAPTSLVAVVLYLLIFWLPLMIGIPAGFRALQDLADLWRDIGELLPATFASAIGVGIGCGALLLFFGWGFPENRVPSILRGWLAPSTALLGFAFLAFVDTNVWFAYIMALTLIFFPTVYRLGMDRRLESLRGQIEVARSLGASDFLLWRKILVPQLWSPAAILGGVAAVWALGEFAVGRVILSGPRTWALLSESLVSSYRIDAGLGLGMKEKVRLWTFSVVLMMSVWSFGITADHKLHTTSLRQKAFITHSRSSGVGL
jgi:thiamine transport system permease protein